MTAPLLAPAMALIAGILLYGAVGVMWWVAVPVVLGIVTYLTGRTYCALLFLSAATGFVAAALRTPPPVPAQLTWTQALYSGIVTEHREYEGAQMMIVRMDSCDGRTVSGFLAKCLIPSGLPQVDETDRVTFRTSLSPLRSGTDLPDETDYNAPLRHMGVTAEAVVVHDSILSVVPEPGLVNDIRRLRRPLQHAIATMPVADDARSFMLAILTGDRAWLTPSTRTLFSSTGVAHILALSGLHVGVITGLFLILLLPLSGVRRGRYIRLILTVIALWLFAIMTGLSPSVVRAVIMATMFAVCTMLQRVWSPLNAMCAAAIIILLVNPVSVYSVGFILSFTAVLSIILFADALNPVDRSRRTLRNAVGYLTVTIAAMLGTGIVSAYCFHIFPVWFLITNVVVMLLVPLLLGAGIVLLMLNLAGIHAVWLGRVIDLLYDMIAGTAEWVSSLPGAVIDDLWIPGWTVWIWYLLLAMFALYLSRRRVAILYAMTMILVATAVIGIITAPSFPEREVYITRSHTETTMLIREGEHLYSFTTARETAVGDIKARDEERYRGYMMRRGIREITPLQDRVWTGSVARRDNMVEAGGRTYVFVHSSRHVRDYGIKPDYAVICRGFRGDITNMAEVIHPDSILLSSDLNLRRHDRYLRELTAASIPHRSLKNAPYRQTY